MALPSRCPGLYPARGRLKQDATLQHAWLLHSRGEEECRRVGDARTRLPTTGGSSSCTTSLLCCATRCGTSLSSHSDPLRPAMHSTPVAAGTSRATSAPCQCCAVLPTGWMTLSRVTHAERTAPPNPFHAMRPCECIHQLSASSPRKRVLSLLQEPTIGSFGWNTTSFTLPL